MLERGFKLHLGVQMKLPSLLGMLVSVFSINVSAVYGGVSLPSVLKGSPRVIRIEASFVCSAVVLNSQTLLIAAHCTDEMDGGDKIRLIQPDNNDTSKTRVRKVVRHPDYRIGFGENSTIDKVYADLAIVQLASPISFPHAGVELANATDLKNLSQFDIWLVANGSNAHQETSANTGLP
ncbi:MAG: trypsin-like serine protease, partial [Kaistella sp.]